MGNHKTPPSGGRDGGSTGNAKLKFAPLSNLLTKQPEGQPPHVESSEGEEDRVSSPYAPLQSGGPLPPSVTVAHVREVYSHASLPAANILRESGIPEQQDSFGQLRALLDDPVYRRKLEQLQVPTQNGQPRLAGFGRQLYFHLRNKRGPGLYRELIRDAEQPQGDLDPRAFRAALAKSLANRAPAGKIAPRSPEEALALFVLAFGLRQPEHARDFVEAVLPLGRGFARFFGVAEDATAGEPTHIGAPIQGGGTPVTPSTAAAPMTAPAAQPPSVRRRENVGAPAAATAAGPGQLTFSVKPPHARPAPASSATHAPGQVLPPFKPLGPLAPESALPPATLRAPAPSPSPAPVLPPPTVIARPAAPSPAIPVPPAQPASTPPPVVAMPTVAAASTPSVASPATTVAPGSPDARTVSPPASLGAASENEHWQAIDTCTSDLLASYESLRVCSEQFESLQRQLKERYAEEDSEGIATLSDEIQKLVPQRRSAKARVGTACDVLERQIAGLRTVLEAEGARHSIPLLDDLGTLTAQARTLQDADIAARMRACAAEIREQLREARSRALQEHEQRVRDARDRLTLLGEPAPETDRFLEERPYLDRPLEQASLRLRNELSLLESRIAERRRAQAAEAIAHLDASLDASESTTEQALQELLSLFTRATADESPRLLEVGLRLAKRISKAPVSFERRLELWRDVARRCWAGGSPASRLAVMASTLPLPTAPRDLFREAEALLRAAEYVDDDPAEFWPVLEELARGGRLAWATALFAQLWPAPPPSVRARAWLRLSAREITESQLDELVARMPAADAYAVRCWAARQRSGLRQRPNPLLVPWLTRRRHPVRAARAAVDAAASSRDPAANALLGALAVRRGEPSFLFEGPIDFLRSNGFPAIAEHLEVFALTSREQLLIDVEKLRRAKEAARELEPLSDQRSPGGAPAQEVWVSEIFPRLDGFRARLRNPRQRAEALEELAHLDPDQMLQQGIAARKIPGINPRAQVHIIKWITTYQQHLPVATETCPDLPASFTQEGGGPALRGELEQLDAMGALGQLAAEALRRLIANPAEEEAVEEGVPFAQEARDLYAATIPSRSLRWRFQLAREDWLEAAGEDVLEELAGLTDPRAAVAQFLATRRLDLAEALLTRLGDHLPEQVGASVHDAVNRARDEMAAEVQSLMLEPIVQALRSGAKLEADLGPELTALEHEARRLLQDIPLVPLAQARERYEQMADRLDAGLRAWTDIEGKQRAMLTDRFRAFVHAFSLGQSIEGAPIIAQAFQRALAGDLADARRCLTLLSLPPDDPRRVGQLVSNATTLPAKVPHSARIRPARAVEVSRLSRFTQQEWGGVDLATLRTGRDTAESTPATLRERMTQQVRRAKQLHAENGPWRPLLAHWALEEGFSQARERSFSRAAELARDAILLLASEHESEQSHWDMDEALTLWLSARLAGSDLARAREPLPWNELRHNLRIGWVVRRFVEYRGLDVLVEVVTEVGRIGGSALPRLLATIGENEHHLRGLLLRELIRSGLLDETRLGIVVDFLHPWLTTAQADELQAQLAHWTSAGTPRATEEAERQATQLLIEAKVPEQLRTRLVDSFSQRLNTAPSQPAEDRFSCVLTTSLVYLSAAEESPNGLQLVADVAYRSGAGNASDLKVSATLEHPSLKLDPAHRIQEVGLLRPEDVKDVVFPLILAPGNLRTGEAPKAYVTLQLYREDSRGQAEQLSRRKFSVNVAVKYPHQEVPTPYITGKCVNELSMIKGRNQEVEEILGKLRGQRSDNFVLIYGMRRIGKSSLLQRLSLDARVRKQYETIHLDLERHLKTNDTPASLLAKFAAHIHDELLLPRARAIEPPTNDAPDCYAAFEDYLQQLSRMLAPDKRLLLLMDEFQMLFTTRSAAPGFTDLIKTLRHWIQYLPVGFVVAGTPELKNATLGPEQRLFQLGLAVELKALDEKAARELIRDPVAQYFHLTGPATQLIVEETDRLPNLIQIVCHHLFLRMRERQRTVATQQDVLEVLESVSRKEEHFSFLLNPVGADVARRAVIRAVAELAVDEKRGTAEELLEHLHSRGHRQVDHDALERCLDWLREHQLIVNWKGELRLRPALLARHVLWRSEYEL